MSLIYSTNEADLIYGVECEQYANTTFLVFDTNLVLKHMYKTNCWH